MLALITLAVVAQLPDDALVETTTHDTCSLSNTTASCFVGGCASTTCVVPEPRCASGHQHTLRMVTLTVGGCTAHTWTWRCAATTTTATTTPTTTATTTPTTTATTTTATTTPTTTATTTPTTTIKAVLETNNDSKNRLATHWIVVIVVGGIVLLSCIFYAGVSKSNAPRKTHAMP